MKNRLKSPIEDEDNENHDNLFLDQEDQGSDGRNLVRRMRVMRTMRSCFWIRMIKEQRKMNLMWRMRKKRIRRPCFRMRMIKEPETKNLMLKMIRILLLAHFIIILRSRFLRMVVVMFSIP